MKNIYGKHAEFNIGKGDVLEQIYLKDIIIVKEKNILMLKTTEGLRTQDVYDEQLIGYGLEGYMVASFFSATLGSDVGFIRTEIKKHGTQKNIDGVVDIHKPICIFVEEGKTEIARVAIQMYDLQVKCIYSFAFMSEPLSAVIGIDLFIKNKLEAGVSQDMDAYINYIYSDEGFLLSSGLTSNRYIETLPAANTYCLMKSVVCRYKQFMESYDVFIGIGYGGVFFSLVSALTLFRPFFVLDVASVDSGIYEGAERFLFFDDFISTGKNIFLADKVFQSNRDKGAIVLYANEKVQCDFINVEICDIILK